MALSHQTGLMNHLVGRANREFFTVGAFSECGALHSTFGLVSTKGRFLRD
jgi:hypothetical protein